MIEDLFDLCLIDDEGDMGVCDACVSDDDPCARCERALERAGYGCEA